MESCTERHDAAVACADTERVLPSLLVLRIERQLPRCKKANTEIPAAPVDLPIERTEKALARCAAFDTEQGVRGKLLQPLPRVVRA